MKKFSVFFIAVALLLASVEIWFGWFFEPSIQTLTFRAFDIGQGDALFFETPGRQQVLIDAGPGNRVLQKLGRAMPLFDRSIDVAVLTNPDKDHMEGFLEVIERYEIGAFVLTGVERKEPSEMYDQLRQSIREKKIPTRYVKAGDRLLFDHGIAFSVLAPVKNLSGVTLADSNDSSIVSRVDFFQFSILLTGDATAKVEKEIPASRLAADVLKVAHHGSKYSSTNEFLDAVHPLVAIISAGKKNSYGHPHADVLKRLESRGIEILQTKNGDVCLQSDGIDMQRLSC